MYFYIICAFLVNLYQVCLTFFHFVHLFISWWVRFCPPYTRVLWVFFPEQLLTDFTCPVAHWQIRDLNLWLSFNHWSTLHIMFLTQSTTVNSPVPPIYLIWCKQQHTVCLSTTVLMCVVCTNMFIWLQKTSVLFLIKTKCTRSAECV